MTEIFVSPSFPKGLSNLRSEEESRLDLLTMAEVIVMGSRATRLKEVPKPRHKPCPWCASPPPLAAQVCGKFVVACESDDCPVEIQATGDTLEEVWERWNRRAT